MAERVKREYEEIVQELFAGNDAALAKLAKVRRTRHEMLLWKDGMPLPDIGAKWKRYFSKRFLGGTSLSDATPAQLREASVRLNYAVGDGTNSGCYARCMRLVNELNEALERDRLQTVDPVRFINYMTFSYTKPVGYDGRPVVDEYGFEVMIFHHDEQRREFWKELRGILREKRRISMQGVWRILQIKKQESVLITHGEPN